MKLLVGFTGSSLRYSLQVDRASNKNLNEPAAGLCTGCLHARLIASDKGSTFLFCELSRTDPRFRKYPPLPVLSCTGFRPTNEAS